MLSVKICEIYIYDDGDIGRSAGVWIVVNLLVKCYC